MPYSIEFTTSALREFRALESQRRVSTRIEELRDDPFPPGVRNSRAKPVTGAFASEITGLFTGSRNDVWLS